MNETIRNLLILQDRDWKVSRTEIEFDAIGPERQLTRARIDEVEKRFEDSKNRFQHLETRRKELEVDVETKKEQIIKFSQQQFETKKNNEYQALNREIEAAKKAIVEFEDEELEVMEAIESAQKEVEKSREAANAEKEYEQRKLTDLDQRETNLEQQLIELEKERDPLAAQISETILAHYERLLESKGDEVVVGIDRGNCGGCHMKLPAQCVVDAKSERDTVACPNCGRLLYYTREMVLEREDVD